MKDLNFTPDVSNLATRIIPIGKDGLDITSVNDGLDYVEDKEAEKIFGTIEKKYEYTEITDAAQLKQQGEYKLTETTKPVYKLATNILDLSTIGIDPNGFHTGTYTNIKCDAIGFEENIFIIEKQTDLLSPQNCKINLNDKTVSAMQMQYDMQKSSNRIRNMFTDEGLYTRYLYGSINPERNNIKNDVVSIGKDGIKTLNGAMSLRDNNNEEVVNSDGVKNVFAFTSSGLYSGYQELGWQNYGGVVTKLDSFLSLYVPEGITIQKAKLRVKIASKYVHGVSGLADNYYGISNVKTIIKSGDAIPLYLDYPFSSEPAVISNTDGVEISGFGTWDVSTGSQSIQIKEIDIKDYISAGNNYLVQVSGGSSTYQAHGEYTDSAICQIELILECFKQG